MVVIDLFKCIDEEFICISKKIGLYIKNSDKDELYTYVKNIVEENYINQLGKNINFRKELVKCLDDQYYKNESRLTIFIHYTFFKFINCFSNSYYLILIVYNCILTKFSVIKTTHILSSY